MLLPIMLPYALLVCAWASTALGTNFTVGQKFQIILDSVPTVVSNTKIVPDAAVFDIDLFDSDIQTIAGLQAQGKVVICYFSAGTYENWRPDSGNFTKADKGASLAPEWPDENWLQVKSESVRKIMINRIDLAASKGCNAIDPDNTDAYQNNGGGLNLTRNDAIDYIKFLSSTALAKGMGTGLKNSMDILADVTSIVQFAVNEQCAQYGECADYTSFLAAGKPVFHIEYPAQIPNIASAEKNTDCDTGINGLSTVFKNITLSGWVGYCDGTSATTPTHPGTGGNSPGSPGRPSTIRPHSTSSRPSTSRPSTSRPTSSSPRPTSARTTTSSVHTTSGSSRPTSTASPSGGGNGCTSKHWDQCGGNNWKGCTVCESGFTCKGVSPPYYYQCL